MERVWLAVEHLSTEYGESMAGCGTLIDRVWREYGWLWESLSTEYGESMVDYGKAYRQSMEETMAGYGNAY